MNNTTIVDVQWRTYRLPFLNSFTTAHGVMTAREGAIVEVITEQGISGIGEIAPLPDFGGASLAEACSLLPTLAACLRGKTLYEAQDLLWSLCSPAPMPLRGRFLRTPVSRRGGGGDDVGWGPLGRPRPGCSTEGDPRVPTQHRPTPAPTSHDVIVSCDHISPSAICGLEIALLDALGKTEGRGVSMLLSPAGSLPRSGVQVNAVVGVRATQAAVAGAQEARRNGFGCVKLKVGCCDDIQEEVERVAAVRKALGPDVHLRLDANEAWNLEEAVAVLSRCAQYDIQYIEQPLKADNLTGMRTLRQETSIPIAADEALHDLESARHVLDSEAADILVIKPQLAGGLRVGQQIIQEAAERGVRSVITSTIEAGIGLVAALHLAAASPTVTLECGLATRHLLIDDLIVDELPIRDGFLAVPAGPGLGVVLDREALDRYS